MKILQAIGTLDPAWGGPVESVRQFAAALTLLGHQVEASCLDSPAAPWLTSFPIPVHALGPGWGTYGYSPRWAPWLRTNAPCYDVVVVHGIWQYQSFGTWRVLRRRKVPYAIFPHGALDPWFKRRYPFKHVKKWMYWPWAEYRVLRDAHAVLFASEGERVQSRESFRLYRANEVVVGGGTAPPPGAVQAQIDRFYGAFPELYAKRLVLYLGRLHPRKACDLAIRAFGAVLGAQPGWHLAIAGPDPIGWKHRLVALADKCGVATRTTWIDALAGDAKWGALRAADVLCLPSHGENFGIGAVEALACGTPVLISNRVGIWREVEACGGGLVAPDTHDGACSLLRSWFSMDENQRRRMQIGARACFEDNFEIGKAAGRLADALAAICTKESKNSAPPHAFSGAGVSPG